MKRLFLWAFLPVFLKNLYSITYAILPARVSGELPFSVDGFEVAKISALYLEYGGIKNIVPISRVEKAYNHFKLTPFSPINKKQAKDLAEFLDAERLLILQVNKKEKGFFFESRVFYPESEITTDTIEVKDTSFFSGLGKIWQNRFVNWQRPLWEVEIHPPLLLIIEASGGNYREIQELSKNLVSWGAPSSAVCAYHKDGKVSQSPWSSSQEKTALFLSQISTAGNEAGNYLAKAITCAQEMISKEKAKSIDIWLLVSSAPLTEVEKKRAKGFLRQLKSKGQFIIYGSGSLSFEERDFYVNLAEELLNFTKSQYQDVLYRKKIGLGTGESFYIFKKGYKIIESREKEALEGVEVMLPAHERKFFHPERLVEQYRKISKNTILYEGPLEILFQFPEIKALEGQETKPKDYLRILLEFPEGSFWFSFPKQSVKKWPKENETITFATILVPSIYGLPLENNPSFVKIFENYRDVPKLLSLELKEYLKSPQNYLGKSVGESSLYVLTGKVREVRSSYGEKLD